MEHESDSNTKVVGALGAVTNGLVQDLEVGWRPSKLKHYWDSQNTEKSPVDSRWLAVTQPPVEKPSAKTGMKNSQLSKINNNSILWNMMETVGTKPGGLGN